MMDERMFLFEGDKDKLLGKEEPYSYAVPYSEIRFDFSEKSIDDFIDQVIYRVEDLTGRFYAKPDILILGTAEMMAMKMFMEKNQYGIYEERGFGGYPKKFYGLDIILLPVPYYWEVTWKDTGRGMGIALSKSFRPKELPHG